MPRVHDNEDAGQPCDRGMATREEVIAVARILWSDQDAGALDETCRAFAAREPRQGDLTALEREFDDELFRRVAPRGTTEGA